jgi:hypothetical protein
MLTFAKRQKNQETLYLSTIEESNPYLKENTKLHNYKHHMIDAV